MDTLECLRKGGRVSLPQALMVGWLQVKPITDIINGKVEALGRPHIKSKAIDKLFEIIGTIGNSSPHRYVMLRILNLASKTHDYLRKVRT